jgi:hypothetical protein
LLLDNSLPGDDIVLVDEGMVHYHPGITEYGFKTYHSDQLKKDPAINPLGIIYCEQSAEIIFNQALRRKENGIHTFSHGPLNREELKKFIEKNISTARGKVMGYKKHGIPILHINTRERTESILEKMNEFVSFLDR